MKKSYSFLSLLRSPTKTVLSFVLIAVVSFTLFSRIGEFVITKREMLKAAEGYYGIGSVEVAMVSDRHLFTADYIYADPRVAQTIPADLKDYFLNTVRYQPITDDIMDSVGNLPYISDTSKRYMTAGISEKMLRLDDGWGFYNLSARSIIEGTLADIKYDFPDTVGVVNVTHFRDLNILAGNPSWISGYLHIGVMSVNAKGRIGKLVGGVNGGVRSALAFIEGYKYDSEYLRSLKIGDRYVFVTHVEPQMVPTDFYLGDGLSVSWCEGIQSIEGMPDNYLEMEEFSALRELVEITNSDIHTFDMVYTDDMSSIMRFAKGDMAMVEGELLTKEHNNKNVCVISKDLATEYKIELGDKIPLKLGTELFEQYKSFGAVAGARERYSPATKEVELEVIGIYVDTDRREDQEIIPHWCYSINTIFVPKTLLPLDEEGLEDHVFSPSEFSFTVDNAWDIPAFIEESKPILDEMGLTLIFHDDGWLDIVEDFELTNTLSGITIVAIFGVTLISSWLIVYLFIGRKRKEYAIMRALGVTRRQSASALMLPHMLIAVPAVLAGSAVAWIYTEDAVSEVISGLSAIDGYVANTSIPLEVAFGCILGQIVLLYVLARIGIWRLSRQSPLALIQEQGTTKAAKRRNKHESSEGGTESIPVVVVSDVAQLSLEKKHNVNNLELKRNPVSHVVKYSFRHIIRSKFKSLLAVLLAALLVGAVGQFAVMRQSYNDMYNDIEVKANFLKGMSIVDAVEVTQTKYVTNPYYEYVFQADFRNMTTTFYITPDIERFAGESVDITYAEGYDETSMQQLGEVCIVGQGMLEASGYALGDKVRITPAGALESLISQMIQIHREKYPDSELTDNEIITQRINDINEIMSEKGTDYIIAGSLSSPSGEYGNAVFVPGYPVMEPILGYEVFLQHTEYILADNSLSDEFREYSNELVGRASKDIMSKGIAFVMDTSKIDDLVKTIELLDILFPVVIAVAVILGGAIPGLIVIQQSKEVSILRVLGTTKRRTRAILILEQMFLCILGICIGTLGLMLYNGSALWVVYELVLSFGVMYFLGCMLGTFISSVVVTHRNALHLLQTKE